MILTLGLCFVLTVERQFKEKLKSIKTFEACLYTAVFKYQNLHRGAITVGADDPGEGPAVLCEGRVLILEVGWLLSLFDSPENRSGPKC